MKARLCARGSAGQTRATAFRGALFLGLATATLVLGLTAPGRGQNKAHPNPGVMPPNSHSHGKTYGEWSAQWWQWAFALPVDDHPLFDTADCSKGQSGSVWFLGGTFAAIEIPDTDPPVILGKAERTCTLPVGKALFFPLINVEASTLEGNGETEEELRAAAEFYSDFTVPESLFCTINGQAVRNLPAFRVQSPLFHFEVPDNNIFQYFGLDIPEGSSSPSVGDGFYVMLAPLAVGKHTLHFGGMNDYTSVSGPIFIQDITYEITVVPPSK